MEKIFHPLCGIQLCVVAVNWEPQDIPGPRGPKPPALTPSDCGRNQSHAVYLHVVCPSLSQTFRFASAETIQHFHVNPKRMFLVSCGDRVKEKLDHLHSTHGLKALFQGQYKWSSVDSICGIMLISMYNQYWHVPCILEKKQISRFQWGTGSEQAHL